MQIFGNWFFLKQIGIFCSKKGLCDCSFALCDPNGRLLWVAIVLALTFTTVRGRVAAFFVTNRFPVSHDLQTMWTPCRNIRENKDNEMEAQERQTDSLHRRLVMRVCDIRCSYVSSRFSSFQFLSQKIWWRKICHKNSSQRLLFFPTKKLLLIELIWLMD